MGRRRGAMVDSTVEATVTTVVGKLIANMTNTSANSSTEVSAPPSSLAPEAGRTVDSVILWLVTVFYFSVSAAALGYFVARWRRRVYGADRVLLRGGSGADMGGAVAQTSGDNEGLLAVVSAVIERATSITALAGAASWQQWEKSRHRRASPNPGGRHRGGGTAGGGGRSRGWLGGLSTFLPGSQARAAAAKRDKQKSDHGHMDNEVLTAVWMEGPAAVGGTIGGSAVSPSNIGSTMTARDQQQQRGEN